MAKNTYIEFQKKRDFGAIIGDTVDFLVKNFKSFSKNVFIIMTPGFLSFIILMKVSGVNFLKMYTQLAAKPDFLNPQFFVMLGVQMILGIISMVLLICVNCDYIKIYIERKAVSAITLGDLWAEVKKDFIRVFLNSIGLAFVLVIFTVIVTAVIAIIMAFVSKILGVVLAVLAVLVLGTYLFVALWPVFFVIVQERKNVFQAIIISLRVVAGNWWMTFGIINVILIIWMLFAMIASIPYYVVVFLLAFHGIENSSGMLFQAVFLVSYLILAFFGSLMYMFPLTASALHYFNLKERKEATSLFAKVETLEKSSEYE